MIDKEDSLPVTRQCEILELSRSGIYYNPSPISAKDVELMRQIDEIHLMYSFYGSRKIRNELWSNGYNIGRDRVRRLMRRMGNRGALCEAETIPVSSWTCQVSLSSSWS